MSRNTGEWKISLRNGLHTILFQTSPLSGITVVKDNGREILSKKWSLAGNREMRVYIPNSEAIVTIERLQGLCFEYTLLVDGKPSKKFVEDLSNFVKTWILNITGRKSSIVFDKETREVWINGDKCETEETEGEDGKETRFQINTYRAVIKSQNTRNRNQGILHQLFVNYTLITEALM